jgi:hypothetical protein
VVRALYNKWSKLVPVEKMNEWKYYNTPHPKLQETELRRMQRNHGLLELKEPKKGTKNNFKNLKQQLHL